MTPTTNQNRASVISCVGDDYVVSTTANRMMVVVKVIAPKGKLNLKWCRTLSEKTVMI